MKRTGIEGRNEGDKPDQPSPSEPAITGPETADPRELGGQGGIARSEPATVAREDAAERNELVRRMAAVLGNVAVLTALLVYFGWVRSEVQARLLGIDESVLGMTTREYLLRSVRSVLVLLLVIAVGGLLWLLLDRPLVRRATRNGSDDVLVRWSLRLLPAMLVLLPASVWLLRYLWPATSYVAFPMSVAAGLLLLVYSVRLRQLTGGSEPSLPGRDALLHAFIAIIVGIALFSSASNYATVEGTRLAANFVNTVHDLPRVTIYSAERLHIDAPGSSEDALPTTDSAYRFRYRGMRLLEHTGGHYFFVTGSWNPQSGKIIMLADATPMRLEFARPLKR